MLGPIPGAKTYLGPFNSFGFLLEVHVVEDWKFVADQLLRSHACPRQRVPRASLEFGGLRPGWDQGAKREQGDKRGAQA